MNITKHNMQLLIPSQLPQKERIDIYKFLIDNQIKFKREPNGEYTSIIHILNPMHYNANDLNEKPQPNLRNTQAKPQTSSSPFPLSNIKPMQKTSSEPNLFLHRSGFDSDSQLLHPRQFIKFPTNNKQCNTNSNYSSQLIHYNETFSHLYPKFYAEVKPMIGIRGRKYNNVSQLKLLIEEIYSIRFIHDAALIKAQLSKDKSDDNINLNSNTPFPIFVYQFLLNKYSKKFSIDQKALNMLLTIEHFKSIDKEIEIFSKFLSEKYDNGDLALFLFAKSSIEKEAKMTFIEKRQNETGVQYMEDKDFIDTELYLTSKNCFNIGCMLFGKDEKVFIKRFMSKIEANLIKGSNCIKDSQLLYLIIEDYHARNVNQRDNDNEEFGVKQGEKPLYNSSSSNNKLEISADSDFFSEDYPDNDNDNQPKLNSSGAHLHQPSESAQKEQLFHYSHDYQYRHNREEQFQEREHKEPLESFYQSLISSYQNESKANVNQTDQKHKALIADFLFSYIQEKEIHIFFSKLFTYDSNDPSIDAKLVQIKQLILTKISLLLNIISSSDKNAWYTSLKIASNSQSAPDDHFLLLINLFLSIASYSSIELIPEKLVEEFSSELLMTNELIFQITKVIENNFK